MPKERGNVGLVLISVALIVAGPICTGIVAHEHVVPLWVSWLIGTFVGLAGIGLLGSLVRRASQKKR